MKLINVKIFGNNFRSLSANKLYTFNHSFQKNKLTPKVFAGLNGSGKSNFLELFSEIFYFLELCHLSTVPETEKNTKNFGFEIEYYLPKSETDIYNFFINEYNEVRDKYIISNSPLTKHSKIKFESLYIEEVESIIENEWNQDCKQLLQDNYIQVRVSKQLGAEPEYSIKRQNETDSYKTVSVNTKNLLPSKLVAYTSGQNELLSNPFYKLKYHYFKEFEKKEISDLGDNHRLFFLDYCMNFSIFISNMLLADERKLSYVKDILRIKELQEFRITINTDEIYKRVIPINERLAKNLIQLKQCATTWTEKTVGSYNLLILDFLVNDATKASFKYHFENAFSLFKVFYELEIFNLFLVNKKTRDLMLQVHKSYNFSDEMPKPDPSRLVFRLEKIFIKKTVDESNDPKNIYYKALSDGEHQFNEVIGMVLMMEQEGCLFLMDEPDTHFNPNWRAKLVKLLNYAAAIEFEERDKFKVDLNNKIVLNQHGKPMQEKYLWPVKVRDQEIIITTHSPFVISDSETQDVYKFEKVDNQVHYGNPKIKTYGASVGLIIENLFNRDISISDFSNEDLRLLKDSIKTREDLLGVKKALNNFGESIEKFDAFSFLMAKEEEFKKHLK